MSWFTSVFQWLTSYFLSYHYELTDLNLFDVFQSSEVFFLFHLNIALSLIVYAN